MCRRLYSVTSDQFVPSIDRGNTRNIRCGLSDATGELAAMVLWYRVVFPMTKSLTALFFASCRNLMNVSLRSMLRFFLVFGTHTRPVDGHVVRWITAIPFCRSTLSHFSHAISAGRIPAYNPNRTSSGIDPFEIVANCGSSDLCKSVSISVGLSMRRMVAGFG